MHGFAIMHYIRNQENQVFGAPSDAQWQNCDLEGFFSIYPGHSVEGRHNWMEAGVLGGKGGISDINLLCPLTLQRLAVNQSKPGLFQKALFDHAG